MEIEYAPVKSEQFTASGGADQYVNGGASAYSRTRLRGLSYLQAPSIDSSETLYLKDKKSGTTLFTLPLQRTDGGGTDTRRAYYLKIPCNGILFPNGIKIAFDNTSASTHLTVFYSG